MKKQTFALASCLLSLVGTLGLGLSTNAAPSSPAAAVDSHCRSVADAMNSATEPRMLAGTLSMRGAHLADTLQGHLLYKYDLHRIGAFRQWAEEHAADYSQVHVWTTFLPNKTLINGRNAVVTGDEVLHVDMTVQDEGQHFFSPEKRAALDQMRRQGRLYEDGDTVPSSTAITHKTALALVQNQWVIVRDDYADPQAPMLAPDHVSLSSEWQAAGSSDSQVPEAALGETSLSGLATDMQRILPPLILRPNTSSWVLDRRAASAYADRWCNEGANKGHGYNPSYRNWQPQNTDCANFVSQCLGDPNGGKIPFQTFWWSPWNNWQPYSYNWVNANGLWHFMSNLNGNLSREAVDYGTANDFQRRYMIPGDLFGYYSPIHHVAIVVALDSNGNCYIDSHTTDRFHTLWDVWNGWSIQYSPLQLRGRQ